MRRVRVHEGGEHWKEEIELNGSKQCTVMSVWAELPDGGEFPNGEVYGADSLKCWASRNWFGVVGSGDFAHYLAGTRAERLRMIKGAFAYAGKRYMAKKEEIPVMEQKPGRYWGGIGRQHLPLGERGQRSEVRGRRALLLSVFSFSTFQRFHRHANCGRKISRPSCFATSSFGLSVCRK
jgi:hypothetical protein